MNDLIHNETATSQSVAEVAETHKTAAFKAYSNSKDAATEAVAHTYLVFLNTLTADGDTWLNSAIDARNKDISKANDAVNQRKAEVDKFKGDKLVNPRAVASKQVAADCKLSKEDWAALERTKIDTPRKGASRFTTVCRLVLEFDHNYHASNTSRYCAVLEWLDAKFANQFVTDIAPLVEAIKAAGGFEKVLFAQRRGEPDGTGDTAEERALIETAIKAKIKAAIANASTKASFAMAPGTAANGDVVIVYGRYDSGTVSVIDEVPLENSEIDGMLRKLNNKTMLPVDEATEFVSRFVSFGDLIETGKKTKHRVNKVAAAEQIKVYSLFSMIPDGAGAKLMISGCMTNASVVVHAKPVGSIAPNLVQTQDYLCMRKDSRKSLSVKLHDRTERTLYNLTRDLVPVRNDGSPSGSAMSWSLTNDALKNTKHKADKHLFWDHMAKGNFQPINVEHFDEQFSATVTQAELAKLFVEYLKPFKTLTPDKKSSKAMSLTFETGKLTIRYEGQEDRIVPITATLGQQVQLMLRPSDVYGIVSKLKQFDVPVVTISGNISGVLKVAFTDGIGEYAVYMPTCDEEQQLTPKFFAKLLPPAPVAVTNDLGSDELDDEIAA